MRAHRFLMTIDAVVDAMQFCDDASVAAIVEWVGADHNHPVIGYDPHRDVIRLPALTRPDHVERGSWVVRWPSGEFGAYDPIDLAGMLDPPPYLPRRNELRPEASGRPWRSGRGSRTCA